MGNINNCDAVQLRTIAGIKRVTFDHMAVILSKAEKIQKSHVGRKSKLAMENRLIMPMEYMHE